MSPLLLLLPLVSSPRAAELIVGATGDYATIQEGLDAASSGDTILVQPGTYTDTLYVSINVTIQAQNGLGSVRMVGDGTVSPPLTAYTGSFSELVIEDTSDIGVKLMGSATFERSEVHSPGTTGVTVTGGTPTISEVAVFDATTDAFSLEGGTPTLTRCIAVDHVQAAFAIATAGTYDNLVSFGGRLGLEFTAQAEVRHAAIFNASTAGISALTEATVLYSLFSDNPIVADCRSHEVEVGHSALWNTADVEDCPSTPFHDNLLSDPLLVHWISGRRPPLVDVHPDAGSPLVDAAVGSDASDGSTADIGPFGGSLGVWTDGDGDGVPLHFDCDDHDADVNLHEDDLENGQDDDCDGHVDEDAVPDTAPPVDTGPQDTGPELDTRDIDGDGYSEADGDCEDHNLATYPGAPEITDNADNDCDGEVDEGSWYVDDDGDGYSEADGDCDDGDAERNPGASEQGEDGVDHDCDGMADGNANSDVDGDGWTVGDGDCDDSRRGVHPGTWDSLDGLDGDCDGTTDEDGLAFDADEDGVTVGELDCNDEDISISSTSPERADDGIDQDCDGVDLYDLDQDGDASPAAGGGDCDDTRAEVHSEADELCDGLDNDCDGTIDEYCGQGDLDGPEQEAWNPGIHEACNCSGHPGPRGLGPFAAILLGALGWLGRRRVR